MWKASLSGDELAAASSPDAYPDPDGLSADQCYEMLELSCTKIAFLMGEWLRVGFCQGNFNADNCLVGGRTMDYGPFGFVEKYDPGFAKWTGSGDHFAFANQPQAGFANWQVLVASFAPVILELGGDRSDIQACIQKGGVQFKKATDAVWRRKLGFLPADEDEDEASSGGGGGGFLGMGGGDGHASVKLFGEIEKLMQKVRIARGRVRVRVGASARVRVRDRG